MKKKIKKVFSIFRIAKRISKDPHFSIGKIATQTEVNKRPTRTEIINFFLSKTAGKNYLEIGVRNPEDNFNHIVCKNKVSVDPGVEFAENPVDYQLTSDSFFQQLSENKTKLEKNTRFDVIFIDGLHLADQVEKDIHNSLVHLQENGFVILHDCNPPTIFHQRENYGFHNSPAKGYWNGTTWKAFYKFRHEENLYSICFDTDWGVAVLSKTEHPGFNRLELPLANPYFEYLELEKNRKVHLNLADFESWKEI
ncbi:MAG TPA: class I SAM-dependent methyltransferase [Flavobacteriaceae bacterium]|nr:class I SAM-dependent methyltransferase [Flavobacteriaceae bacterium]